MDYDKMITAMVIILLVSSWGGWKVYQILGLFEEGR